jgi:hypothetical protein
MARNENPPFARGETFYNGGTIDANDLGGLNLEGKEWVFEDQNPNADTARSNKYVRCRVVRNTAAIALLPKRLVRFERDASNPDEWGRRVDGYAAVTAAECYPVDEYLPAAGVPVNDLFYIVVEGPAVILTSLSNMTANIDSGGWVVSITAATSGATTAGRINTQDDSGGTTPQSLQIMNRIGRALGAVTTAQTNTDVLIEVGKW